MWHRLSIGLIRVEQRTASAEIPHCIPPQKQSARVYQWASAGIGQGQRGPDLLMVTRHGAESGRVGIRGRAGAGQVAYDPLELGIPDRRAPYRAVTAPARLKEPCRAVSQF